MKLEFTKDKLIPTIAKLSACIQTLKEDKTYTVEIKAKPQTRSLNANAYMWVLLDKLAAKLNVPKTELYRGYVRQYGKSVDYQLPNGAIPALTTVWSQYGTGWTWEKVDDGRQPETAVIRFYYGSSCYGTKRMARLIDAVVQDCHALGIETMTPQELEILKNDWRAHAQHHSAG